MRRVIFRHVVLLALPLLFGLGARYGVAHYQKSCGSLVGPLLAAKCGRIQRDYYLQFQTIGTAAGCLLGAVIGIWLERRRMRAATRAEAASAA